MPLDPPRISATLPASEKRSTWFIVTASDAVTSRHLVAVQDVHVELDAEARLGRRQDAPADEIEALLDELAPQRLDAEMRRQVFDEGAVRRVEGEMRGRRHRQPSFPAMRHDDAAARGGEIADLLRLDEAADAADIRLRDVDLAALDEILELPMRRQPFAGRDLHRRGVVQLGVLVEVVDPDRRLEKEEIEFLPLADR